MGKGIERDKPINMERASNLEHQLEGLRDSKTERIFISPKVARDMLLKSLLTHFRVRHSNRHDVVEALSLIAGDGEEEVDYTEIHLDVINKISTGQWPSQELQHRREI